MSVISVRWVIKLFNCLTYFYHLLNVEKMPEFSQTLQQQIVLESLQNSHNFLNIVVLQSYQKKIVVIQDSKQKDQIARYNEFSQLID